MKTKEMKVKATSYRTWLVTDEEGEHNVSLIPDENKYLCTCDHFIMLKSECPHIQLIKELFERGD